MIDRRPEGVSYPNESLGARVLIGLGGFALAAAGLEALGLPELLDFAGGVVTWMALDRVTRHHQTKGSPE